MSNCWWCSKPRRFSRRRYGRHWRSSMTNPDRQEVQQFCAAVVHGLGFGVDEHNIEQVDEVLRHRLRRTNCETAACYLRRLEDADFRQAEVREVAAELSVGETYFFRHPEHFRALAEVALPARVQARGQARQLRLLSAGCASGEEPYSLAATVRRAVPMLQRLGRPHLGDRHQPPLAEGRGAGAL